MPPVRPATEPILTIAPPLPPVFGRHAPHRLARAQHRPEHVDAEDLLDVGETNIGEPVLDVDAGIVDQRVDRAELAVDGLEQAENVLLRRRRRPAPRSPCRAGLADRGHHRVGARLLLAVVDRDVPALAAGAFRDRGADAAPAAGDDHDAHGNSVSARSCRLSTTGQVRVECHRSTAAPPDQLACQAT